MIKHLLAFIMAGLLLTGCSKRYNPANTPFAIYHPISEENVRKLEKGITTPGETINLLESPLKKISATGANGMCMDIWVIL